MTPRREGDGGRSSRGRGMMLRRDGEKEGLTAFSADNSALNRHSVFGIRSQSGRQSTKKEPQKDHPLRKATGKSFVTLKGARGCDFAHGYCRGRG